MARAIDGDELLGIERLLDTDVIRKSKTASWLLDQVLHDIQAMPTLALPNEPACPCDLCMYNPPSSLDGKPCTYCPATGRRPWTRPAPAGWWTSWSGIG